MKLVQDKCGGSTDWCKKGSIDGISWGFRDGKTCFDALPAYRANPVLPSLELAGDREIEETGCL